MPVHVVELLLLLLTLRQAVLVVWGNSVLAEVGGSLACLAAIGCVHGGLLPVLAQGGGVLGGSVIILLVCIGMVREVGEVFLTVVQRGLH